MAVMTRLTMERVGMERLNSLSGVTLAPEPMLGVIT